MSPAGGDKRMSLFYTVESRSQWEHVGYASQFSGPGEMYPALRTGDVVCGVLNERLHRSYLQIL